MGMENPIFATNKPFIKAGDEFTVSYEISNSLFERPQGDEQLAYQMDGNTIEPQNDQEEGHVQKALEEVREYFQVEFVLSCLR